MKILFLCKKDNALLNVRTNGLYWDDNISHWFNVSMKSHPDIEFTWMELDHDATYDLKKLVCGYDMVSFYEEDRPLSDWGLPTFENIEVDIPKIAFIIDCHFPISNENWKSKIKPDVYVGWQNDKWFRQFYTDEEKYYRTNCYGIDFSRVPSVSFESKTKDKPLLAGVILLDGKEWMNKYYKLRGKIFEKEHLRHYYPIDMENKSNVFDNYYRFLSSFGAGFASNTNYISRHFFEVPACCSVMFYEDTDKTEISKLIGIEDGVSGVSINEENFEDKVLEYIETYNHSRWEDIAINGHNLIKNNYTSKQEVDKLYKYLKLL